MKKWCNYILHKGARGCRVNIYSGFPDSSSARNQHRRFCPIKNSLLPGCLALWVKTGNYTVPICMRCARSPARNWCCLSCVRLRAVVLRHCIRNTFCCSFRQLTLYTENRPVSAINWYRTAGLTHSTLPCETFCTPQRWVFFGVLPWIWYITVYFRDH